MGLDMYLYLSYYESEWRIPEEKREEWKKNFFPPEMEKLADHLAAGDFFSKTTKYQVAYWRKANAVHKWFVDNCADGVDECQEIDVPIEKLEHLVAICSEVLSDHDKAPKLLPTADGFFFGDTEYDDWYFSDLEATVKMLDPIIEFIREKPSPTSWDIIYQASW